MTDTNDPKTKNTENTESQSDINAQIEKAIKTIWALMNCALNWAKKTLLALPQPHKSGYLTLLVSGGFAFLVFITIEKTFGLVFFALTAGLYALFAQHTRTNPKSEKAILAPLDGFISDITADISLPSANKQQADQKYTRITLRAGMLKSRILRAPSTAQASVETISLFIESPESASTEDGTTELDEYNFERLIFTVKDNEKVVIDLEDNHMIPIKLKNTLDFRSGSALNQGEIIGVFKSGNDINIYLPEGTKPKLVTGQTVISGETVLA